MECVCAWGGKPAPSPWRWHIPVTVTGRSCSQPCCLVYSQTGWMEQWRIRNIKCICWQFNTPGSCYWAFILLLLQLKVSVILILWHFHSSAPCWKSAAAHSALPQRLAAAGEQEDVVSAPSPTLTPQEGLPATDRKGKRLPTAAASVSRTSACVCQQQYCSLQQGCSQVCF